MTLILLALGWLAGIAAVALWSAPPWAGAMLLAWPLPALAMWRRWRAVAVVVGMLVAACAGGLLFSAWQHRAPPDVARYLGRTITVQAVVASEPSPSERTTSLDVSVDRVRINAGWVETGGRVRLSLDQYASYLPGDRLEVTGKLEEAPVFDDFNYREYLARHGIAGSIYRPRVTLLAPASTWDFDAIVARARLRLDHALQRALPEPVASLAGGIAFGRDDGLPGDIAEDFRTTGLAHIVAVSGSNVVLLSALAFALLLPLLGRRLSIVPAVMLVAGYVVIAGASASVVRAGIMAAILLAGEWLGRPQSGLPALAAAVIGMTLFQPSAAVDVGFQLSVAATAGLIAFSPWIRWALERWLCRGVGRVLPGAVFESAALTLSATIATLPILWVNFGRVSLVSPISNIVVAPVLLVALPFSMATAVLGSVSAPAGWLVGLIAYYPVAFILGIAESFARIPGAAHAMPSANGTFAFVAFVLLGSLGWLAYRHLPPAYEDGPPLTARLVAARWAAGVGIAAAGVVAVVITSLLPLGGPGRFEMTALDIGQGDAILLKTPHGHTMLVDGGPSDMLLARQLGATLPHWDRSIDIVFMTHPDEDHVGGLPGVLRRFDVPNVWDTGVDGTSAEAATYAAEAGRTTIHAGDYFELDGVRVDVLWPPADAAGAPTNATSLVLRVTYGETHFLLTGDLEGPEQLKLVAQGGIESDVLKVPHHGSKTSDPAFFDAVGAGVAVISVGAGNPYGHPAPETIAALAGETMLRTDLDGRVTVRSDGTHVTWSTER